MYNIVCVRGSCYVTNVMFDKHVVIQVQWSPSITDTTETKDFVLYSEVSFAQGVIVDHVSLTTVASYAGARLWTMKSVVLIKDLLIFSP